MKLLNGVMLGNAVVVAILWIVELNVAAFCVAVNEGFGVDLCHA